MSISVDAKSRASSSVGKTAMLWASWTFQGALSCRYCWCAAMYGPRS
ncbi:Uncharacterised protein [Mycobacteroides abscessus subsp. abscessus]|nr:Uncharacterised protein [Mycobacteroides abscessus subsp. abscessus]